MFRRKKKTLKDDGSSPSIDNLMLYEVKSSGPPLANDSLDALDSSFDSKTTNDGDDESIKSLSKLTIEEKEQVNRRLLSLEERSKSTNNLSSAEASQLGLIELIDRREWMHVFRKIDSDPSLVSIRQLFNLDGSFTRALPLHLAVSKKPPVRN